MKRFLILLLVFGMLLILSSCGKTRTVTCDRCGTDIEVKADSNITDDWIVFCPACEAEIGPRVE